MAAAEGWHAWGVGIGSGIRLNGQLYRDAGGTHPEIGHSVIRNSGRICSRGGRSCREAACGGAALMVQAEPDDPSVRVQLPLRQIPSLAEHLGWSTVFTNRWEG